jgi:hypothetical protein
MAEKFDNKMLMDPKSWVQYRQFVDSKRPISNPYFNDPEYLRLYSQYITSLKNYTDAILEAIKIYQKSELPGPRRRVDFGKLEKLRRFYEADAYKYFSYRQGFNSPSPPDTHRRAARSYLKDATAPQYFGEDERRAVEKIQAADKEIAKLCEEVWKRYKEASEPKSDEIKKELLEAIALAQLEGIDTPTIREMSELGSGLHN